MSLAGRFDAFLIDLDGVVWRGDEPIAGAAETIAALRGQGKRVVFVTNNSSKPPREFAVKLARMRMPTEPRDVVTSGHAVVQHLRSIGLGRGDRVHLCGTTGLAQVLRTAGFDATTDTHDVSAVVVGWSRKLTFEDIRRAADVARGGVPFVGANRDSTYPTEDGLVPGAGSILAAVETAAGCAAEVVGKPHPALVQMALARAGVANHRALFVGDRAESDVAGAVAAGVPVALVLTGVTTEADLATISHRPDWILASLADVLSASVDPHGAEGKDQRQARHEAADVGEEGNSTSF